MTTRYNGDVGIEYDDLYPAPQQPRTQTPAPEPQAPAAPTAPNLGYNYEQLRDRWMSWRPEGGVTMQNAQQWLSENQDVGSGVRMVGDKWDLNNDGRGDVDVVMASKGGGGYMPQWTNPYAASAPSPEGGAPGMGINGGAPGNAAAPSPYGASMQSLIDMLTKRANQSLTVNPATDPSIRQQADPYAAAQERQRRNYLADLAERSGPNANLRGEERLAMERAGQATGQFESELVGREIAARRQEIQNALTQMGGLLTEEQRLALQRELGLLNDATQRLGIQTSANTAQNAQNLAWQQALLNNDQFNASLGLNAENQYNYWDAVHSGLL